MGIIRKTMSVGTVGLVDFRSDKERAAAYARGARKHARRTARATQQMAAIAQRNAVAVPIYSAPQVPPGWYACPEKPCQQRYWDGQQWTSATAPR